MSSRRIHFYSLLSVILLLLIPSCSKTPSPAAPDPNQLIIGNWLFTGFETVGDTIIHLDTLHRDSISLNLHEDGSMDGQSFNSGGFCNEYRGGFFELGPNRSIHFEGGTITQAGCIPKDGLYIDDLYRSFSFEVSEKELYLYHDSPNHRLDFKRR